MIFINNYRIKIMELKNLESLKDELAYLEEAEELLQAIYSCFDYYALRRILEEKHYKGFEMAYKLDSHFNFDDNE